MIAHALVVVLCAAAFAAEQPGEETAREMPDCGVGCIYGALKECGRETTLREIEQRLFELDPDTDLSKLSLAQIRRATESFGLHARSVRVDLRYPEAIPIPAILYIDRDELGNVAPIGHVVLVRATTREGATVSDLELFGRTVYLPRDLLAKISDGRAVLVSEQPIRLPIPWVSVTGGLLLVASLIGLVLFRRRGMSRKRASSGAGVLLLAALGAGVIVPGCREADDVSYPIEFTEPNVDKGTFRHGVDGTSVSCEFPFVVSASSEVVIKSVESTCSCTSLDEGILGVKLAPGSQHKIALNIETGNRAGLIEALAQVLTVPSSVKPTVVSFRVLVIQPPKVSPPHPIVSSSVGGALPDVVMHANRLRGSEGTKLELDVEQSDLGPFVLKDASAVSKSLGRVSRTTEEINDHLTLTLGLTKSLGIGNHDFPITLAWKDGTPATEVPVTVHVAHPVSLGMERFFFGKVKAGKEHRAQLAIKQVAGRCQGRMSAECDLDFVQAQVDEGNERLSLVLTTPDRPGRFDGTVTLQLPQEGIPALKLEVSGIVTE
jgi:hypothetical protein